MDDQGDMHGLIEDADPSGGPRPLASAIPLSAALVRGYAALCNRFGFLDIATPSSEQSLPLPSGTLKRGQGWGPLGWYILVLPGLMSTMLAALCSLVLVLLIACMDYVLGPELSFALFYVVPIAALSWQGGYAHGILLSVVAAGAWYGVDALQHPGMPPVIRLWNGIVHLGFFALCAGLFTRLRDALRRERFLARTDLLTGASNARTFYEAACQELERAARSLRPLTVAYFDLDDFKAINDQLGHTAGDEVLRRVATVIQRNIRTIDVLARMGGDEFALLFPEADAAGATAALLKLRESLRREIIRDGSKVTFSIGAATFLKPPTKVDTLVHKVDALMYEAKRAGKNRVRHDVIRECEELLHDPEADERRGAVRFLCGTSASVAVLRDLTEEPVFATIRDLSQRGVGLYLSRRAPEGTLLTVEPVRSSKAKTLLVRVVHCRQESGGWLHGAELATQLSEEELRDWLE